MTISTALLFDRSVQLMTKQQSDLASIQERVATGKELVRPSDSPELAVNIARIKSTIGQLDGYKSSLNGVNDRLRIEESYLGGGKGCPHQDEATDASGIKWLNDRKGSRGDRC